MKLTLTLSTAQAVLNHSLSATPSFEFPTSTSPRDAVLSSIDQILDDTKTTPPTIKSAVISLPHVLPATDLPPLCYRDVICSSRLETQTPCAIDASSGHSSQANQQNQPNQQSSEPDDKKLELPPVIACLSRTILTSQYSRPHVDHLETWPTAQNSSTAPLHPGDFDRDELLTAMGKNRDATTWIYWGHGETDRLRGYGHLTREDLDELASLRPPFALTSWISCNTLGSHAPQESIAWQWYASGATNTLLAAHEPVLTELNEAFTHALSEALSQAPSETLSQTPSQSCIHWRLSDWLFAALMRLPEPERRAISEHYRLLGNANLSLSD
jgi:hypothetical protein